MAGITVIFVSLAGRVVSCSLVRFCVCVCVCVRARLSPLASHFQIFPHISIHHCHHSHLQKSLLHNIHLLLLLLLQEVVTTEGEQNREEIFFVCKVLKFLFANCCFCCGYCAQTWKSLEGFVVAILVDFFFGGSGFACLRVLKFLLSLSLLYVFAT